MLDEPSAGLNREEMQQLIAAHPAHQRSRPRHPPGLARHGADGGRRRTSTCSTSARSSPRATWRRSSRTPTCAKCISGSDDARGPRTDVSGYGALTVLHDVSLSIGDREAVAIVGANGAGKTTLVRTICGLLRARSGRIVKNGVDISQMPPHELVRPPHRRRAGEPPPVRRADGAREPAARGTARPEQGRPQGCSTGPTSMRCSP